MSQQQRIPQNKEALLQSYTKRLKDDIKSMLDNFTEVIKLARMEEDSESTKTALARACLSEQDHYEMQVRSANIVRAGESLMQLVSDLKQFLILNDFPSVNESIASNSHLYKQLQGEVDIKLMGLRDEMAADLYELEEEYYSSVYK